MNWFNSLGLQANAFKGSGNARSIMINWFTVFYAWLLYLNDYVFHYTSAPRVCSVKNCHRIATKYIKGKVYDFYKHRIIIAIELNSFEDVLV